MSSIDSRIPGYLEEPFVPRVGSLGQHAARILVAAAPVLLLLAIASAGAFLRVWQLGALGFNSDEAVYAGQAAAIAADPELKQIFPIFRAHPLLYQYVLAVGHLAGMQGVEARVISAIVGLLTVGVTFLLGRLLYGTRTGVVAALFMALMPYHVVVTRQVLLDGPMTLFATLALYLVARYAHSGRPAWLYAHRGRPAWLYAAGGALGLTFLAKETGIVLVGAVYSFFALAPEVRVRLRDLAFSIAVMALVIAPFPISLMLAGGNGTSKVGSYFVWQLFRRANHDWTFYPTTVPPAIGLGVLAAALVGLLLMSRSISWREKLLVCWTLVPLFFFQLWPVKGFQYLLVIGPAIVILASVTVAELLPVTIWSRITHEWVRARLLPAALATAIAASLALTSWYRIQVAVSGQFLAGSGGVPGGREAGLWLRENVPEGATLMTIGPSMANILMYYGHRLAYGLAVSPNPLHRNPSYEPIDNPDLRIRSGEIQYVVWDSFSAARSGYFAGRLQEYASRYHGRVIHTETITTTTPSGLPVEVPVIVVYAVRP